MYPVSDKFREAVNKQNHESDTRIRFKFGDTLFTKEDINLGAIVMTESVNPDENLKIGSCLAANLSGSVQNFHRLLSGFEFGECTVSLAIRTGTEEIVAPPGNPNAYAIYRHGTDQAVSFAGYSDEPYLRIDGSAPTAQPPFPVYAIYIEGNTIVCIAEDGRAWAASWIDGRMWAELLSSVWDGLAAEPWDAIQGFLVPAVDSERWRDLANRIWDEMTILRWNQLVRLPEYNDFMLAKFARWAKLRRGISYSDDVEYEFFQAGQRDESGRLFQAATAERYEYAKLGVFLIDTPQLRRKNTIQFSALDRMKLFDIDATAFWNALPYPITIGEIYAQLCNFVGVSSATLGFINRDRSFASAPFQAGAVTAREILGWIAEAACSFARMTRDGEVELAWFAERPVTLPPTQQFDITTSEYDVSRIDKLQVMGTQNDIGVIIGTGDNGYQILDNPMLYGASDAEVRALAVPIYNRLNAFEPFSPIAVRGVCDWSIQAGDVIRVEQDGVEYQMPIYLQTISWTGGAPRVTYESTGSPRRPVVDAINRRTFQQNRAMHELRIDIDGVSSTIVDVEGNVAELTLTAAKLSVQISDTENNLTSLTQQTADGFAQTVNKNGIISAINQSAEQITIEAERLNLNGAASFNDNVTIGTDGKIRAVDGEFSGRVNANSGKIGDFDISGGSITSSNLTISPDGRVQFGAGAAISYDGNAIQLSASTAIRGYMNITNNLTVQGDILVGGVLNLSSAAVSSLKSQLGI